VQLLGALEYTGSTLGSHWRHNGFALAVAMASHWEKLWEVLAASPLPSAFPRGMPGWARATSGGTRSSGSSWARAPSVGSEFGLFVNGRSLGARAGRESAGLIELEDRNGVLLLDKGREDLDWSGGGTGFLLYNEHLLTAGSRLHFILVDLQSQGTQEKSLRVQQVKKKRSSL
jgi:hypothetical protein